VAKVLGIKHLAFGVKDAKKSAELYQRFIGVTDVDMKDLAKAQTLEAHFKLGGTEFQLCQSVPADGRFNEFMDGRGGQEGLHHICFEVDSIDEALAEAQAKGATLKECRSCKVSGSHKHSEGWVAFLNDSASGIELEYMQVYKEGEGPDTAKREM
jgi:methylmalonyl-CoA/ethylmalonyl-CoA epimerase